MNISFPPQSAYLPSLPSIAFPVVVDDHLRHCMVTEEALMDHFGASSYEPPHLQHVFESHRHDIEATAADRIRTGATGDVILRTQDF